MPSAVVKSESFIKSLDILQCTYVNRYVGCASWYTVLSFSIKPCEDRRQLTPISEKMTNNKLVTLL